MYSDPNRLVEYFAAPAVPLKVSEAPTNIYNSEDNAVPWNVSAWVFFVQRDDLICSEGGLLYK